MPLKLGLYQDVVAILGVLQTDQSNCEPRSIHGTGFVIAPGLLVTCWYCVSGNLPERQIYGAAFQQPDGRMKIAPLTNISQDKNGSDLATANLTWQLPINLRLAEEEILAGEDVWTAGHPLTELQRRPDGIWVNLQPQYLRAYITRLLIRDNPQYGETMSYEMSVPAHAGLSGAPLVKGDGCEVVGAVYGTFDAGQIVELAQVDEETGDRIPEIQRIISFGVAHHTTTLLNLTGTATRNMPLWAYVSKFCPKEEPPSDEQQGIFALKQLLERKRVRNVCPACKQDDLVLQTEYSAIPVVGTETGPIQWTGRYVVCLIALCPRCGYFGQHVLSQLRS